MAAHYRRRRKSGQVKLFALPKSALSVRTALDLCPPKRKAMPDTEHWKLPFWARRLTRHFNMAISGHCAIRSKAMRPTAFDASLPGQNGRQFGPGAVGMGPAKSRLRAFRRKPNRRYLAVLPAGTYAVTAQPVRIRPSIASAIKTRCCFFINPLPGGLQLRIL